MELPITCNRFIVVAGGVISGVGKGVATASLGKILKEYGYTVALIKIDPYINCDAGTLRPTEHGEVWVTEDGGEIDQDLGTYERFLNQNFPKKNNITTGQIYKTVIDRERHGEYLGQTVQFIPHITDEIVRRITAAAAGADVAIVEIGGTVGDHENIPFLFALKSLERRLGASHMAYVLVTYLPVPGHIEEMKTKPTQQAVRLLCEQGIMPDFIVCRSKLPMDTIRKKKIEEYAHIPSDHIISAPDVGSVYEMPLIFEEQHFGEKVMNHLQLHPRKTPNWADWKNRVACITSSPNNITVAIIGKYTESGSHALTDSYLSVSQALIHAGTELNTKVNIVWISAQKVIDSNIPLDHLFKDIDGVIVPGGFGSSGVEGKIKTIEYVRTHTIPYLGICYGMQLAVVEYARHKAGLANAHTTEVDESTPSPVVTILPYQIAMLQEHQYGGTMRLGACEAVLKQGTKVAELYGFDASSIPPLHASERHRHRYEVNPKFVEQLEKAGLCFSGYHIRTDGTALVEYLELPDHPFFVGCQAHPEFMSRLENPNPLFFGFVKACITKKEEK